MAKNSHAFILQVTILSRNKMKKDIKLPLDLAAKLSGLRDLKVLSQLHQQVDRSSSLASKRWRKGHTESDGFLIFSFQGATYLGHNCQDLVVNNFHEDDGDNDIR